MPVIRSKMAALKKQYGEKKGENVYYAMENIEKHSRVNKKRKKKKKKKY